MTSSSRYHKMTIIMVGQGPVPLPNWLWKNLSAREVDRREQRWLTNQILYQSVYWLKSQMTKKWAVHIQSIGHWQSHEFAQGREIFLDKKICFKLRFHHYYNPKAQPNQCWQVKSLYCNVQNKANKSGRQWYKGVAGRQTVWNRNKVDKQTKSLVMNTTTIWQLVCVNVEVHILYRGDELATGNRCMQGRSDLQMGNRAEGSGWFWPSVTMKIQNWPEKLDRMREPWKRICFWTQKVNSCVASTTSKHNPWILTPSLSDANVRETLSANPLSCKYLTRVQIYQRERVNRSVCIVRTICIARFTFPLWWEHTIRLIASSFSRKVLTNSTENFKFYNVKFVSLISLPSCHKWHILVVTNQ